MKKLFFTALFVLSLATVYAQKSAVASEGGVYKGKEKEAERLKLVAKAKADEAEAKAEFIKSEAARKAAGKKQFDENAKNNIERKVTYAPIKQPAKVTPPKSNKAVNDKTVLVGAGKLFPSVGADATRFLNEDREIILENSEWTGTYSFKDFSTYEDHKSWGVVRVSAPGDKRWDSEMIGQFHYAIVNSKGQYLYNDRNCRSLEYLKNGWLLIGTFDNLNAYLYNMNTKKKILLSNTTHELNEKTMVNIASDYVSITPGALRPSTSNERISEYFIKNNIVTAETLKKDMFTFVYADNSGEHKVYWHASQVSFGILWGGPTLKGVLNDFKLNSLIVYHVSPNGTVSKQIVN